MRSKTWLAVGVLTSVLSLSTGITIRAAATSFPQEDRDRNQTYGDNHEHDQDYSKNKNYRQGMRDGQSDREHNRDHSKKRHFKKDEDHKAYEAGYQQSRQGSRSDRDRQ